ncbi:adenosine receptor A2b isoform X1 [Athene cunicularia]|uniref:Adenosine A2b receptor n=1 Tax=Athene cunicularia TaxID=194338 RepID=A0A663MFE4_ATHCN|nr:adenosine receptor A2b isoform X1 [Athene cunicularia]
MDTMKTTYIVLELIIAVLSIAGNVLVCWAVAINSTLKNATNYFLVSLAVADVAVGLLAIPFAITISIGFQVDFHSCLFFACFVLVLTQSSIFSLLAVAIDRYLAIKIPLSQHQKRLEEVIKLHWQNSAALEFSNQGLVRAVSSASLLPRSSEEGGTCPATRSRYNSLVTGKRARGLIAVLWLLSFGIGLTPLMGWNKAMSGCPNATNETGADTGTEHHGCFISCLFENVVTMSYMVYFNFFGCVLLPLVIMLGIYIKIFMVACKQLHQIELMGNSRTTLQKEVHAAKSLAIIVGLFAFCWLPLHILNCITHFHEEFSKSKPEWVMYMAIILSHANSVINPIIYAYRIRDFRYTFRKIISKILCKRDDFRKCTTDNNQHLTVTNMNSPVASVTI